MKKTLIAMFNKYSKKEFSKSSVFIWAALFLLTSATGFLNVSSVNAGEGQANNLTALCYLPNANDGDAQSPIKMIQGDSEKNECRSLGKQVIEPGQPLPVAVCKLGDAVQYYGPRSAGCENLGGTVIPAGQPMPTFTRQNQPQDNKNPSSNPPADPNITNAQREELANCDLNKNPNCLNNNPITKYILLTINFLTVGVGVVVTIMIIIGGIQYASAGANPQQIQAAKSRISNAIIALLAYLFLFAFLQWLVPGGLF